MTKDYDETPMDRLEQCRRPGDYELVWRVVEWLVRRFLEP